MILGATSYREVISYCLNDVQIYGLKTRSASWFRQLFLSQGWESPAQKPVRIGKKRRTHPVRTPLPRRGMMVQIDGTEFDWFQNGTRYTLHLCVDDATTCIAGVWHSGAHIFRKTFDISKRKIRRAFTVWNDDGRAAYPNDFCKFT